MFLHLFRQTIKLSTSFFLVSTAAFGPLYAMEVEQLDGDQFFTLCVPIHTCDLSKGLSEFLDDSQKWQGVLSSRLEGKKRRAFARSLSTAEEQDKALVHLITDPTYGYELVKTTKKIVSEDLRLAALVSLLKREELSNSDIVKVLKGVPIDQRTPNCLKIANDPNRGMLRLSAALLIPNREERERAICALTSLDIGHPFTEDEQELYNALKGLTNLNLRKMALLNFIRYSRTIDYNASTPHSTYLRESAAQFLLENDNDDAGYKVLVIDEGVVLEGTTLPRLPLNHRWKYIEKVKIALERDRLRLELIKEAMRPSVKPVAPHKFGKAKLPFDNQDILSDFEDDSLRDEAGLLVLQTNQLRPHLILRNVAHVSEPIRREQTERLITLIGASSFSSKKEMRQAVALIPDSQQWSRAYLAMVQTTGPSSFWRHKAVSLVTDKEHKEEADRVMLSLVQTGESGFLPNLFAIHDHTLLRPFLERLQQHETFSPLWETRKRILLARIDKSNPDDEIRAIALDPNSKIDAVKIAKLIVNEETRLDVLRTIASDASYPIHVRKTAVQRLPSDEEQMLNVNIFETAIFVLQHQESYLSSEVDEYVQHMYDLVFAITDPACRKLLDPMLVPLVLSGRITSNISPQLTLDQRKKLANYIFDPDQRQLLDEELAQCVTDSCSDRELRIIAHEFLSDKKKSELDEVLYATLTDNSWNANTDEQILAFELIQDPTKLDAHSLQRAFSDLSISYSLFSHSSSNYYRFRVGIYERALARVTDRKLRADLVAQLILKSWDALIQVKFYGYNMKDKNKDSCYDISLDRLDLSIEDIKASLMRMGDTAESVMKALWPKKEEDPWQRW